MLSGMRVRSRHHTLPLYAVLTFDHIVDEEGYTAADVALSLNNADCYRIIRDAGIRLEFLLHLLASRDAHPVNGIALQVTDTTAAGLLEEFLSTKLRYTRDEQGQDICLASLGGGEEVGVMMGW